MVKDGTVDGARRERRAAGGLARNQAGHAGRAADHRVEEETAEHGVDPGRPRDRDRDVAADLVVQVHARLERRDRLRAQHGARRRVADLHLLGAAPVVPVDEVELEVVRLAVGEVHDPP